MGKQWKQCHTLFSWAPKSLQVVIAAMKIKDACSLVKKNYDQSRQHIKSRDITSLTKVCIVKNVIFPGVMYGCNSGTIKKAEHQKIDAFELWCWRRLLRVPWTARRSNQSLLKEISYSLKGLMLKLKLQYFGHLMQRANSFKRPWCWERLKAGKGDDRGWDGWMASLTQWTWVWTNSRRWWRTGKPVVLQSMGSQRVRHDWATEQQNILEGALDLVDPRKHVSSQDSIGKQKREESEIVSDLGIKTAFKEEAVFEFYLDWAEFQVSYSPCLLGVWRVECQVENWMENSTSKGRWLAVIFREEMRTSSVARFHQHFCFFHCSVALPSNVAGSLQRYRNLEPHSPSSPSVSNS